MNKSCYIIQIQICLIKKKKCFALNIFYIYLFNVVHIIETSPLFIVYVFFNIEEPLKKINSSRGFDYV